MIEWSCTDCDAQASTSQCDSEGLVELSREWHELTTGHTVQEVAA